MEMKMIFIAVLLLATCHCQDADIRMPPSITKGPEKFRLFQVDEKDLLLDCVATGVPDPLYEWFKDGSLMDLNSHPNIDYDETQPGTGSIIISEAYSQDEGYYQCVVENDHGKALSQVLFLQRAVLDSTGAAVTKEYTATEGESLVVPCLPRKSVPIPKFTWSYGETESSVATQPIVLNKRINIDEEGNLYFSYVVPEDEKNDYVYKCNVLNNILDITTGGSYSKIKIYAYNNAPDVKPENMYHTGEGQEIIALKGKEMRLKCLFKGKPEVQINWKQQGSNSLPPSHTVQSYNTELVVDPVSLQDEARYTCTGSNRAGTSDQHINVKVEAEPVFQKAEEGPHDMNVTEGDTAIINCVAFAIPAAEVQWFINGRMIEDANPGKRYALSDDGNSLSISDVCKDCADGSSDLQNIQCNASNVHGYAYGGGYINILLRTLIAEGDGPAATELEYGEGKNTTLLCKATSDDSTEIEYSWLLEGEAVDYVDDEIWMTEDNSLKIQAKDEETAKKYAGEYTCVAVNGYSTAKASAMVSLEGYVRPVTQGGFDLWIIFVIIAIILLLLILLLCCCLCCQRNRGDAYPVDEKERKQGLDPEKELADSGFQDYQRPEDEPMKGSRASLTSTIKLDSDDEGSLAEYGDLDTGKFNEDGSFIGQYTTDKKKRPPTESNV